MAQDWTKVNPATLTLWYQKLAYHRFEDDLTSDELQARVTYRIVTAILDCADQPSVQGYYFKTISPYHVQWLQALPLFERIGYVETAKHYETSEQFHRLWLLSDWNTTENRTKRIKDAYAKTSHDFLLVRVRYWRVYKALKKLSIGNDKIQEILFNSSRSVKMGLVEGNKFLDSLGFSRPDIVSDDEINDFVREFVHKPGHVYIDPCDFTMSSS